MPETVATPSIVGAPEGQRLHPTRRGRCLRPRLLALALIGLVLPRAAEATWSIVAVDADTGEVGSAGASCTPFVAGIVGLVPGRGALVDQAISAPGHLRRTALRRMAEGATPEEVLEILTDPQARPDLHNGQYGIVTLAHLDAATAFTGREASEQRGHLVASGVAVQGNLLVDEAVVPAALEAFDASAGLPLHERLLRALEAGSARGGDRRCVEQTAQSAYLLVARLGDARNSASCGLISPYLRRESNPVAWLRERLDSRGCAPARLLPMSGFELLGLSLLAPPLLVVLSVLGLPSVRRRPSWTWALLGLVLSPLLLAAFLLALRVGGYSSGIWREMFLLATAVSALLGGVTAGAAALLAGLMQRVRRAGAAPRAPD